MSGERAPQSVVALDNRDREQIHIPNAIQSHGVLVTVEEGCDALPVLLRGASVANECHKVSPE